MVTNIYKQINAQNESADFPARNLFPGRWTFPIEIKNENKCKSQAAKSGYHKQGCGHLSNQNRSKKGAKGKVDKKIGSKLKVFIGNTVFKKLVRDKQYYQDQKKYHGFSKADALEKENYISAGQAAQKKLNEKWNIRLIRFQESFLPTTVICQVKNIDADRQAYQMGKQHGITIPAINASECQAIPNKTTDKKYQWGILPMFT